MNVLSSYACETVPPLYGDITHDLDMYPWPIAPIVWIASQYQEGLPQEQPITPALEALAFRGHIVHRVPGLEPILNAENIESTGSI